METRNGSLKKVAFVSSYPPRKCGIATFTSDLINNMKLAAGEEFEPQVFAMQSTNGLQYHKPVKLTIRKNVKYDYIAAANYINLSDVDVVSVQHEFGLFGGRGGSHLSYFLKRLDKPVVITLHTVLDEPSSEYYDSLIDVCAASQKVVVMNKRGIRMLNDIYGVSRNKIELIPHGIPNLPFGDSSYYKEKLGIGGRETILTFGLLSENKGIEVMLKALPRIVKSHPSILYIILGATHPEVLRREGNSYKWRLRKMVRDLQLEQNVAFFNSFVEDEELFLFLGAADVYVTPYLREKQLTSGTLAFAMGAGKAIVSTPYWAAEALLGHGRGKLVGFGNSADMACAILEILSDETLSLGMRMRAYQYGRKISWPKIGDAYRHLLSSHSASIPIPSKSSVDSIVSEVPVYKQQLKYA